EARLVGAGACEVGAPDPRRGRRVLRRAHTVLHGARGVDPLAGGGERRRGLLHGVLRLLAETRPQAEHAGQAKAHAHQSPTRPWSAATLSSYEARWSSGWRRNAVTSGSHAIASSIAALEPRAYAPIWIRSSAPRRLADGEADLALRHRDPRERVHHEEDVAVLVAEPLGERDGEKCAVQADEWRLVGRGGHDDGALEAGAEVALDELADFTATLADERDDVHVGARVARHHPEERAFPDARAREDAEPLATAAGEQRVDRADAEVERLADRTALERVHALAVERVVAFALDRAAAVERPPEAVDDPPAERVPHADERPLAHEHHLAARRDAG